MAAIASKLASSLAPAPAGKQQGRVARVSAKAAGAKRAKESKPVTEDEDLPEDAFDSETDEDEESDKDTDGEAEAAEVVDAKASKATRGRDSTYLSMYFRDMAMLDVLRPEEEFTSARELETLEIMLWEAALSHGPALEHLIAAIDPLPGSDEPLPNEVKALRKFIGAATVDAKQVAKAARKLRSMDTDHLFIDAVLLTVDRIAAGIGARGSAVGTLGRERARAEWLRRVHQANRATAEARNDFVRANLRLVVSIARRFNHGRMALADLIQEGNIGLMKAVERYDYKKGFRFSTYASWWIRHAISRALADKGREVRLPVHMIDAQHRVTKARRQLTGQLGRNPTSEELAAATQMPIDKIEKMRSWLLEQSISIDKPVGDDEGRVLGEILEDPDREAVSPTEDMEWDALQSEVRSMLGELRPIEADILRQRFGLGTEQELTLKEIGDKYNLSRERIRQLQEQALMKMRRALARRDLV